MTTKKKMYKKKTQVRKTVNIIPKTSYLNFMKYAYVNKEVRKNIPKQSNQRRKVKTYKK